MDSKVINIGFGNTVMANRVLAILNPKSAPIKKIKDEAKANNLLIDATEGRRTRSVIVLDSNHVVLSSVQRETIAHRFGASKADFKPEFGEQL